MFLETDKLFTIQEKKNETKCSNMMIRIDSSAIKKINFYDRPTATLTPTDEMPVNGLQLDGFIWRNKERPTSVNDLIQGTSSPSIAKKSKESNVIDTESTELEDKGIVDPEEKSLKNAPTTKVDTEAIPEKVFTKEEKAKASERKKSKLNKKPKTTEEE
jgi:hypothetical protein